MPCGPILARWDLLRSGGIDAGLQGAPLDRIALDEGFVSLGNPRDEVPDFQFTSLDVDAGWAAANRDLVLRFCRGFLRAHERFYTDRATAARLALQEAGIAARYAEAAWEDYTRDAIFPRDGEASEAGVQALIDTSALIRDLPARARAADYIDRAGWPKRGPRCEHRLWRPRPARPAGALGQQRGGAGNPCHAAARRRGAGDAAGTPRQLGARTAEHGWRAGAGGELLGDARPGLIAFHCTAVSTFAPAMAEAIRGGSRRPPASPPAPQRMASSPPWRCSAPAGCCW